MKEQTFLTERYRLPSNIDFFLTKSSLNVSEKLKQQIAKTTNSPFASNSSQIQLEKFVKTNEKNIIDKFGNDCEKLTHAEINSNILHYRPDHVDDSDEESSNGYNTIEPENCVKSCEMFKPAYKIKPPHMKKTIEARKINTKKKISIHKYDSNFSFRSSSATCASKSMLSEARAKLQLLNSKIVPDPSTLIDSNYLYDLLDTYNETQQTQF